jgi:plasmid rolling circle replication initiator protein Rep
MVNVVNQQGKVDSAAEWKEQTRQKWTEEKQKSLAMSEKLREAAAGADGLISGGRVGRMADCGQMFEYQFCADCQKWQISRAVLCRDRLCPLCKWRLSVKRYTLMIPVMRRVLEVCEGKRYSFITLSVKNCKAADISATVKKMTKIWNTTINRRTLKREIKGFARSFEITYNTETKEFHPHFHVIAVWDGVPCHDDMINAWLQIASREGLIADIKAQNGYEILVGEGEDRDITGAVLETFKYETKHKDLQEMPMYQFREFAMQMSGLRSVSFGGIIKDIMREQGVSSKQLEADAEDTHEQEVCGNCGSVELTKALAVWAETGYRWVG